MRATAEDVQVNRDPVPWRVGSPACGAYDTTGYSGAPRQCAGEVVYAGPRLGLEPVVEVWLAFVCELHRHELLAPRQLLPRDVVVWNDWLAREKAALDGIGWDPPRSLAVGTAA